MTVHDHPALILEPPARAARRHAARCAAIVVAATLAACATSGGSAGGGAASAVMQRAPFDIDCPSEEIQTVTLNDNWAANGTLTMGARGCGKKATYFVECVLTSCTARLDSQAASPSP